MRCAFLALPIFVLAHGTLARADCGAGEVSYFKSGCDNPPQQGCWPQKVQPTPAEWCGCDGKTFGGLMPSSPWRFTGKCAVEIKLLYFPAAEGNNLTFEGTQFEIKLGRYQSCTKAPPAKGSLTAARCKNENGAAVEIRVARVGDALVVTGRDGAELAREHSPPEQKITAAPFAIVLPPPPRPFLVRLENLADSRRDSSLTGKRKLILSLDGGWHEIGVFTTCAERPKPVAPALMQVECTDGAIRHLLTPTTRGQSVILLDQTGDAPAVETIRVEVPSGRPIMSEGFRTY